MQKAYSSMLMVHASLAAQLVYLFDGHVLSSSCWGQSSCSSTEQKVLHPGSKSEEFLKRMATAASSCLTSCIATLVCVQELLSTSDGRVKGSATALRHDICHM